MSLIENMKVEAGKSCLYSSLANLLRYYGFQLSESDVFFICRGFDYKYLKTKFTECDRPSDRFIYRDIKTVSEALQKVIGFKLCYGDSLESMDLVKQVNQGIENNNPVLLLLNPSVLTYTPREFDPDGKFELHCIILKGIDWDRNLAHIVDTYVVDNLGRVSVYEGTLSMEIIIKEVKGFLYFDEVEARMLSSIEIEQSVCDTLNTFLKARENDNECTGWSALQRCIEDITFVQGKEEEFLNNYYLELSYLIRAHFLFIFDYLSETLKNYSMIGQSNIEVYDELDKLRSEWSTFCIKLWKASFHGLLYNITKAITEGRSLIDRIRHLLERVVQYIQE